MKQLRTLGAIAVAIAALFALVGAGTASATVICKNNLNTEHCSEPYPVGTKGIASLQGTMTLETEGILLNTCTGSTVSSSIKSAGSATSTVTSELSSIFFSGCTRTMTTNAPGWAELHWIPGTDNGTLTTIGTEVTINTIFGSCVYGASKTGTDFGTTVGGNPGSLTINLVLPKISGPCPSNATLKGKYVATEPTAAWVAGG